MGRSLKPKVIIVSSLTGNTQTFADYLKSKFPEAWVTTPDRIIELNNFDLVAFGSYTWKDGKIPKDIKEYILSNAHRLYGKRVIVFGSGNSIYPKYCEAVKSISKICKYYGCSVIGEIPFEQRFDLNKLDQEEKEKLEKVLEEWGN